MDVYVSGKWDGVGAVAKTKIRNGHMRNPSKRLHYFEVVSFLKETLSTRVPMSSAKCNRGTISRYFHNVEIDDIPRVESWNCNGIPGSRSLHSISSLYVVDPTKLLV
jgi:hypothetical protein